MFPVIGILLRAGPAPGNGQGPPCREFCPGRPGGSPSRPSSRVRSPGNFTAIRCPAVTDGLDGEWGGRNLSGACPPMHWPPERLPAGAPSWLTALRPPDFPADMLRARAMRLAGPS